MRRYRIDRHPLVENDLDVIQDYIAPFAGIDATLRILEAILARIEELADLPHIGTVRNEISPGLHVVATAVKATICFTVDDQSRSIRIICVAYAGQDWRSMARDRGNPGKNPPNE